MRKLFSVSLVCVIGLGAGQVLAAEKLHETSGEAALVSGTKNSANESHSQNTGITLALMSPSVLKAGKNQISFKLFKSPSNPKTLVYSTDLQLLHEKKLHVVIYDQSLQEFRHVHPQEKNGVWTTDPFELPVNGKYWMWAEGQLKGAEEEFTISDKIEVKNGRSEHPKILALGNKIEDTVGNSKVIFVKPATLKAGQETMAEIEISRTDGKTPKIKPYLGALAHIVLVPLEGNKILHVHPMEGSSSTKLNMHTEFPSAGDYRMWVQFIEGGELKVAALSVSVP